MVCIASYIHWIKNQIRHGALRQKSFMDNSKSSRIKQWREIHTLNDRIVFSLLSKTTISRNSVDSLRQTRTHQSRLMQHKHKTNWIIWINPIIPSNDLTSRHFRTGNFRITAEKLHIVLLRQNVDRTVHCTSAAWWCLNDMREWWTWKREGNEIRKITDCRVKTNHSHQVFGKKTPSKSF